MGLIREVETGGESRHKCNQDSRRQRGKTQNKIQETISNNHNLNIYEVIHWVTSEEEKE